MPPMSPSLECIQKSLICITRNRNKRVPSNHMVRLYHLLPLLARLILYPLPLLERFFASRTYPWIMCRIKNIKRPTSSILITTVSPIKCAALLNISPSSFAQMQAFNPTCTIRNKIKNRPVSAIINFLPTEEVKKLDHFILRDNFFMATKTRRNKDLKFYL